MCRPSFRSLLCLVAWTIGLSSTAGAQPPKSAKARPKPQRYAWTGLVRGPLSPKQANTLETRLLETLAGYESFRLVDAGGHALDPRLLASDAARAARLRDEGVDAFLRFKHKAAINKLSQAVAVFEQRLTTLSDYEILKDALLARAEALYQSGEKGAAKASLQNWLALRPTKVPTTQTHPKGFVRLYKKAKAQLGAVGRIQVECEDPGCWVQLDGASLGEAPQLATKVRPGQHYLVAQWTHSVRPILVRVAPGREAKVIVRRDGPSEQARQALLGVVTHKQGLDEARALHGRVAGLARAERSLIAAVYETGGQRYLILAHHDSDGDLGAVIRAPLGAKMSDEATDRSIRQAGAALFVDRREGELDLNPTVGAKSVRGLAAVLYQGQGSTEAAQLTLTPSAPPPPAAPPPPDVAVTAPAPEQDNEDNILGAWWFWAAVGTAVVAGAVTAGVLASQGDPTTTRFEVQLP